MTDWVFVVLPLLVLPIVLLFRFVGCEEPPPKLDDEPLWPVQKEGVSYKDTILAEKPSVLAYWRLVDGPDKTKAKDEKPDPPSLDGEYKTVPPPGLLHEKPDAIYSGSPGSEAANGGFTTGVDSLIAFDSANCRAFNGGYVRVAGFAKKTPLGFAEVPYPKDFTIEAWIDPQWTQLQNYEHTLVDATGHYQKSLETSARWHGFRIFADREDRWRVYLAPDGDVEMTAAPIVAHNAPTYLAVTVETVTDETDPNFHKRKVKMFVNGKKPNGAEGTASDYSPPDGAPLFIGVSNTESVRRHPVLSPIQEVVLYKKALSPEVIKKHHDIGKGVV